MTQLEDKIDNLKELHSLFNGIRNSKTKETLMYKLNEELDYTVDYLETLYYDVIKKHKRWIVSKLNRERHETIVTTKETMQVFMPYMIAYNVMNASQLETQTESYMPHPDYI